MRIALTVMAAAAIGFDRRVEGHPAGMRTTLLVALGRMSFEASGELADEHRRQNAGFLRRLGSHALPLGILTGVVFIGGGVILKRGDTILGVTTAATLWFVTLSDCALAGDRTRSASQARS